MISPIEESGNLSIKIIDLLNQAHLSVSSSWPKHEYITSRMTTTPLSLRRNNTFGFRHIIEIMLHFVFWQRSMRTVEKEREKKYSAVYQTSQILGISSLQLFQAVNRTTCAFLRISRRNGVLGWVNLHHILIETSSLAYTDYLTTRTTEVCPRMEFSRFLSCYRHHCRALSTPPKILQASRVVEQGRQMYLRALVLSLELMRWAKSITCKWGSECIHKSAR